MSKCYVNVNALPGSTTFLVMHPFDLLKSRLANPHELRDKQTDKGAAQLRLAIDVARAYSTRISCSMHLSPRRGARRRCETRGRPGGAFRSCLTPPRRN